MITYYRLGEEGIERASEDDAIWIHLESPDMEEIDSVSRTHSFPLDYLTSTLDPDEVSRTEYLDQDELDEPVLISLLYPGVEHEEMDEYVFVNRMLSIVLQPGQIVTCVKKNPDFLEHILDNRLELVTELKDVNTLVFELAWHVARSFVLASRMVREDMETLQRRSCVYLRRQNTFFRLADLDKSIVYISSGIEANQAVIQAMTETPYLSTGGREAALLHDVQVEIRQADSMSSQTRHMLQQLDTTFSSIIQHNLNQIVKILTSLTIIITLPNIVFGFWGMNVALPFMDHELAHIAIIVFTIVLMLLAVVLLRRKDLL